MNTFPLSLRDEYIAIAEQLNQAVEGKLDFRIETDSDDADVQKLAALCNVLLDSVHDTLSELHRARATLKANINERTRRLDLILSGTNDGVWEWDVINDELHFSARWFSMLGLPSDATPHNRAFWLERIHPKDRARLEEALQGHILGMSGSLVVEYRIRDAFQNWRMMICRGLCARDEMGRAWWMAGTQTDVTEQRYTDSFTGLGNGDLLNQLLEDALETRPARTYALITIALTNARALFESSLVITKRCQVVKGLARAMRSRLPLGASLIALQEYTFALLIEASNEEEVLNKLRPLEDILTSPIEMDQCTLWLSHAIGVMPFTSTSTLSPAELRSRAQLALCDACKGGVGKVSYYSEALAQGARRSSDGEQLIRSALSHDGVLCFLQPIVSLRDGGRVVAFEALMRLRDSQHNIIGPGAFIEAAESTSLIHVLSQRLADQALMLLADPAFAARFGSDFLININLSRQQLLDASLVDRLMEMISAHGVSARRLQVEVTETSVLAEPHTACMTLRRLRQEGVRVALDDFGSGYSSLALLCELPLDTVKVDRGLVKDLETEPRKRHVLASVIELCKRLGFGVVVEGVESATTLAVVQELGAEQIQGFIYSRPISVDSILSTLSPRPQPQLMLIGH